MTADGVLYLSTLLVFSGALSLGFRWWNRSLVRVGHQMSELRKEVEVLGSSAVGLGQRVDRLAGELRRVKERLEQLESSHTHTAPYAQAIRMASRGTGVDELMETFGLSRVEAELLHKVHPELAGATLAQ